MKSRDLSLPMEEVGVVHALATLYGLMNVKWPPSHVPNELIDTRPLTLFCALMLLIRRQQQHVIVPHVLGTQRALCNDWEDEERHVVLRIDKTKSV